MNSREYETMRHMEDDYWWYRGLHSLVTDVARRKLVDASAPLILDAGCGTGGTLAALRRSLHGADLTGLDHSAEAIDFTRARNLGVKLVCAPVEEMPFPDSHCDMVISLDVLSAKGLDDARALRECCRVLKGGKFLVLNLPAFDLLRSVHDAAIDGARRYTRGGLRRLLREAGFEVEWLTYWNAVLFPPIAVWRLLTRPRAGRPDPRSDLHPLPAALNRLLAAQLRLELRLAQHVPLPFGTSVFAVARKPPCR
jgi:SAM-dependent methyltransferase